VKKLIKTLKNIWSIEELRGKILFTLMMIALYRVGSHIVLPGIDPGRIEASDSNSTGILGLIDAFSGGALPYWYPVSRKCRKKEKAGAKRSTSIQDT
jgi:preprotein translocase subunit SecY